MNTPFFSIVIPALNEQEYLPKLLLCLNQQVSRDFEVIVVDGLSKDETATRVRGFSAKFPLQLHIHKATNVGAQRNFGADHATGEFLLFFDADVFIKTDFLQKLQENLIRDSVDFASPLIILDSPLFVDRLLEKWINGFMILLTFFRRPLMSGQSFVMRRSLFTKIGGFDPTVVHAEDGELSQRAARHHYKGKLYTDLKVYVSPRRFDKEGRLRVLLKYVQANIYMAVKGPIRSPLFSYPMGGGKY